jgi:hypothetical protein
MSLRKLIKLARLLKKVNNGSLGQVEKGLLVEVIKRGSC